MFVSLLAGILALAGCVTPRIDWNARIGHYTYDQAIRDFGPPDRYAKLSDGEMVADWLTRRGAIIVEPEPYFPGPYGWSGLPPTTYSEMNTPSEYMQLMFATSGILEDFKYITR